MYSALASTEACGEGRALRKQLPLRVLVISDLYPAPPWPAAGVFVERQTAKVSKRCDGVTVVVPTRAIPPMRVLRQVLRPQRFIQGLAQWRAELAAVPRESPTEAGRVLYPRYLSPPRRWCHGTWGFFAYWQLKRLLQALDAKEEFGLIHAHYASPAGTIALLAGKWMRVPIVISVHGADVTYTVRQWPIGRAVISWALGHCDAVLVNSSWTGGQVESLGVPRSRIHLVRLGAEPPAAAGAQPRRGDGFSLLTTAYLAERKGHTYVLEAVRVLLDRGYDLRYVVVGNGPMEASLAKLATRLGIRDRVSFEGYQPHERIWDYLGQSDLFVLPSWKEAFGVAYVEAMSVGKPVIGCAGEGGPEDLRALGDCIELVPPRDAKCLADAIARLMDDPGRRKRLAAEGLRVARTYYTWEKNADDTLAIYRQLMRASGKS